MDVRVGLWRRLSAEELMLLNCGVGDSWESFGQQGDPTSPFLFRKSVLNIHWKIDAKAETPILWQPDAKKWLIWKDPDAGKDWRQEKKGMTEDEMVGWHHRLKGHEFDQALGVGEGQGSLEFCSPWGCKESDMTEWLNWCINIFIYFIHLFIHAFTWSTYTEFLLCIRHCIRNWSFSNGRGDPERFPPSRSLHSIGRNRPYVRI